MNACIMNCGHAYQCCQAASRLVHQFRSTCQKISIQRSRSSWTMRWGAHRAQGPLLGPLLLLLLPHQHLHLPRSRRQTQAGRRVMLTRQRNSMCIRQQQRSEGNIKRKITLLQVLHASLCISIGLGNRRCIQVCCSYSMWGFWNTYMTSGC